MQRERDFSRAVVRSTPSFLALVDGEGTLLGVNRALERAAGIPEESWIGMPFWKLFIAAEDVPRAKEDFGRMRGGRPARRRSSTSTSGPTASGSSSTGPRRSCTTPRARSATSCAAST